MKISSDGSFFRITGPFCGEFTSHRWIPLTRASNADFDVSLMWVCISCWTNGRMTCDLRLHDVHVTSSCITEPTNSPVLWDIVIYSFISLNMYRQAGIILWMYMANERCCYNVMSSPIGWAHKKWSQVKVYYNMACVLLNTSYRHTIACLQGNDLFLFIEKCRLYNYADDNSLDSSSENLADVLYNLRHDGRNAIEWFAKNGMQANPDKFHFMLFSPTPTEQQVLHLCDGTSLMSETEVTVLGLTIDDKLCFSQHISICCKKAARQLNALARISKHLNINSRMAIYNSFIMSNFNYCPLVWHFCSQVNNQKLEKIQERALRILFADYNSSYTELLGRAGTTTLLIQRLHLIALTVFKSLHGLNPPCLNDMFTPKQVPYRMRDSSLLEQSRCRTTTFGLRSISYIGAKLWNDLPSYLKETTYLSDFKMILQTWTGPDLNDPFRSYVWAPSDSLYKSEISFVSYIESRFYTPPLYVDCITALCRSFYACRLQQLTHRYPRLMAGTLYICVLHWSAGVARMGFRSSLGTLKASFNVPGGDWGSHPDDLSASV